MLSWIATLFSAPVFADDVEKTRQARLVRTCGLIMFWMAIGLLIVAVLLSLVQLFRGGDMAAPEIVGRIVFALVLIAALCIVQMLNRAGYVRLASLLLTGLFGGMFTVGVWLSRAGITAPFFLVYILVVFVAGLLLGRRWAVGVAVLSVLWGLFLVLAELGGLLEVRYAEYTPVVAWLSTTVVIGFATGLFYVAMRNFDRSLTQARQVNEELDGLRASLEARVDERTSDLSRRARYLEATAEVARYVTSELDMRELLARIVTLISEQFSFYHAGIFLIDAAGEWAELQAASSEGGQRMLARGHRLEVGHTGMVGYVTSQGEPRIASDVGEDAVFFDNPDLPATRSAMTLPLRARGRIIGALDVQSTDSAAFTQEDVAVLQVLADQVAVAISNARLFERLQESIEAERRAYGELSYRAWAEMLESRGDLGYIESVEGVYPVQGVPLRGDMKRAAEQGEIVESEDGTVAIPVSVRGGEGVLGVVRLRKPEGAGEWTTEQLALMQEVTEQLGVALERARLYQDSRRLAMRERLVSEATQHMRQTLNVEAVLKTAADEIYRALQLDEIVVRLASRRTK